MIYDYKEAKMEKTDIFKAKMKFWCEWFKYDTWIHIQILNYNEPHHCKLSAHNSQVAYSYWIWIKSLN